MQYTSSGPAAVVVGTGAPEFSNIPDASGHGTGIASIVAAIGNNAAANDGSTPRDTAGVMWGGVSRCCCCCLHTLLRLHLPRSLPPWVPGTQLMPAPTPPASCHPTDRRPSARALAVLPSQAAIYSCRFMEADGFGRVSDALRCLNWLLANNVSVSVNAYGINIGNKPWDQWTDAAGAFDPTTATTAAAATGGIFVEWRDTLVAAGSRHLFVTSAGNGGELLEAQTQNSKYYWMPAQLHLDNMIVVGATGEARCVALRGPRMRSCCTAAPPARRASPRSQPPAAPCRPAPLRPRRR